MIVLYVYVEKSTFVTMSETKTRKLEELDLKTCRGQDLKKVMVTHPNPSFPMFTWLVQNVSLK